MNVVQEQSTVWTHYLLQKSFHSYIFGNSLALFWQAVVMPYLQFCNTFYKMNHQYLLCGMLIIKRLANITCWLVISLIHSSFTASVWQNEKPFHRSIWYCQQCNQQIQVFMKFFNFIINLSKAKLWPTHCVKRSSS